ncbi:hypothetical protein [Mesorhizobium sp. M8A.F.Ca.ET.021.01.1.1]|uniref:hypothetical protein n=1 Tax=Mesorhizobium sp. M8A.F.Ca.ET.021.01.1.1 TaxID=2496757 RepID=UPI000FCC4E6C|nr:hypothetical protein [Mesorhizobium sp. M8A.F.Ca.ET.021.01.1.1]RUW53741.1 hypothetical protein EOA36_10150 [Mesorhizobium sp. M8A.F.Ca.ET.021.01.1.1]
MSNELTVSNPGAAGAGSATGEGLTTGVHQTGIASPSGGTGRKAEIERAMREDFDLYERSGMSAEYRQILESEQAQINPDLVNPTQPMDAEQSRNLLCGSQAGRRLVSDWDSLGGFRVHLGNVQRSASEIVRSLGGNREQRVFMEHFDRHVPEPARLAVYAEIAAGSMYVTPATAAEVNSFAATPAGKALVAEWGADAAACVAQLRARAKRIDDGLDEDDAHEFWFWLDEQTPATAAAIFRKMAG